MMRSTTRTFGRCPRIAMPSRNLILEAAARWLEDLGPFLSRLGFDSGSVSLPTLEQLTSLNDGKRLIFFDDLLPAMAFIRLEDYETQGFEGLYSAASRQRITQAVDCSLREDDRYDLRRIHHRTAEALL